MIAVRDVLVRLGGVEALRLESLDLDDAERLGICGPNGCGKSTLLRLLAGLIEPTHGVVTGRPDAGDVVLVHQTPYLFRGTAQENIELALRVRRRPLRESGEWLERLGAADLRGRPGKALSGGERRRVAIARALCVRPRVLLLDEPFAALDLEGIEIVTRAIGEFRGTLVIAAPEVSGMLVDRLVDLTSLAVG